MNNSEMASVLQGLDDKQASELPVQYVPANLKNTFWGRLPNGSDSAVASIHSGESVVIDTISHEGLMPDQGSGPLEYFGVRGLSEQEVLNDAIDFRSHQSRNSESDGSHVITGPVAVENAHPGDVLMVSVERLVRRAPYGVISTRHFRGVMTDSSWEGDYGALCKVVEVDGEVCGQMIPDGLDFHDPAVLSCGYPRFPLQPFLGIMGVAPDVDIHPCSIPPYFFGGNIDVNDLTEGSLLFLPVQVEGAKFYIGDPHFAQGDAEVSLTALEAPLRATLRLTVIPAQKAHALFGSTTAPIAYAHGNLLALGLGDNLDSALRKSVENSIGLLSSLFGLPERVIYLYLSAAVNFDISQAVDITKGVHSRIPLAHFTEHLPGGSVDGFQRLIHDISLDIQ